MRWVVLLFLVGCGDIFYHNKQCTMELGDPVTWGADQKQEPYVCKETGEIVGKIVSGDSWTVYIRGRDYGAFVTREDALRRLKERVAARRLDRY